MKICIPIEHRHEGGMYTFLANFIADLERRQMPFTRDLDDDYDVLFVNAWVVPYEDVRRVKESKPDVRVVHRIDGSAQDYGREDNADALQARANLLADVTVFQSRYSKVSTREKFRVIPHDGSIIYNAVDVHIFHPDERRAAGSGRVRIANVAWSTNRRKGTWRIDRLAAENPDVDFVLCGRYEDLSGRPNIQLLGHVDRAQLASTLRSCDLFLNLSENDPCPNVVLEAMASGLPVLYVDSGGVPELVGPCGAALADDDFAPQVDALMERRPELSDAARRRAETLFAPAVIFPQYVAVIESATRQPLPGADDVRRWAEQGYPVGNPAPLRPRAIARGVVKGAARAISSLVEQVRARRTHARTAPDDRCRVGWITSDSFDGTKRRFSQLHSFTRLRAGNVGEWLNAHEPSVWNEVYRPGERYDVVVFHKMMDARSQDAARALQAAGTKVVFDANVNYYEIWGEYVIPGTRPTDEQQHDAIAMTQLADWVVADSSYIASIAATFTPRVSWIPDNVNLEVYRGVKQHVAHRPVQLIWSGVGKKAAHLLEILPALGRRHDVELVLVSDTPPECLPELQAVIPCRVMAFTDQAYAAALLDADIIISPKRLINAYELGHTEYKITLGMAVGLPAVASPQQSYVEAIQYAGGGVIAASQDEWVAALDRFVSDPAARQHAGDQARRTVVERYSAPVIARQFLLLFESLVGDAAGARVS